MKDEGYVAFDSRRYGILAALRRKQWWSFEGLDPDRKLYFVFLALEAFPTSYVSLKLIDYQNNRRWNSTPSPPTTPACACRLSWRTSTWIITSSSWRSRGRPGCRGSGWRSRAPASWITTGTAGEELD